MILIPLNYLKKHLFLPSLALSEIAKKLTYFGLETQLVKKKDQLYLEINSLPNRADLLCWKGIVQEIKILLNCAEKKIKLATLKQSEKELFSVTINTPYCLLFDLFLVKNIQIKESPVWLKEWLVVNQISPVNNLVDSANLAKLETGQSWRLYDYDALAKKRKIVVEPAGKKETIRLVSEKELILTSKDLVSQSRRRNY